MKDQVLGAVSAGIILVALLLERPQRDEATEDR